MEADVSLYHNATSMVHHNQQLHLLLYRFILFGATCLWVEIAIVKFFNKFSHKITSFAFIVAMEVYFYECAELKLAPPLFYLEQFIVECYNNFVKE